MTADRSAPSIRVLNTMTESAPATVPAPVPVPAPARKRPSGLGRGLNALLGEAVREEPLVTSGGPMTSGLKTLAISDIRPHPGQPRRYFDEDALNELAQSIKQRGVIQPVIVRPRASGSGYELVAGERRWRAAQRARLHEIPAIISDLSDEDTMALALIENIQREDLNAVEEAQAYQRLVDEQGYSQNHIAEMVDKSRSHIANLMRLLVLPQNVLQMIAEKRLTMGHARALINADQASDLAQQIVAKGLSVRQVEKLVRQGKQQDKQQGQSPDIAAVTANGADHAISHIAANADLAAMEQYLEDLLGLKVQISADKDPKSGAVSIRYASLDQLDLICQRLSGDII